MDCESAQSAAGIDPKILDSYQSDTVFTIPWENSGYERPLDWDTSQDSNHSDSEFADLSGSTGLLGQPGDYHSDDCSSKHATSPDKFGLADASVEGTLSSTVSPKTLPSADDNFQLDESWPPLQMFNNMMAGFPMEGSLLYSYAKEPASADAFIVEDGSAIPRGQGLSDISSDHFMPFQSISHAFPFTNESWAEPLASIESMPRQAPVAVGMGPQQVNRGSKHGDGYQNTIQFLETRWLDSLESQLPSNMTSPSSFSTFPQRPIIIKDEVTGQDMFQYKSENSSVSDDIPGTYDFYSATGDDVPAFADRQLDEEWKLEKNEASLEDSNEPQTATAFAVSEDPETLFSSVPSSSRASPLTTQRPSARPQPLAVQSAAIKKRKKRTSIVALNQDSHKPLQIVQEDGQGGSIASADFVSPPRGARRKGPLTMAGRANAGMRRKNKDTCVQCRLNKRKCDGNAPCEACRPTLHEQPCARACFSSIVEYGTCNYISQRAINHPTLDKSGRVRLNIPSEFDLNDLLSFLGERQGKFNIRASQAWGSLYVLDLGETYKFLRGLSEYNGNSRSNFLEFIDRRIVESKDKSKNWLTCVKDCDPMRNIYTLLSQWNNMPSRASYSFIPLDAGSEEKPMDVRNPEHQREILLAAQLSRIVCRMLEVEGFRKLERDFYNIKWKQISQETHMNFLKELGHILLTLRWRVSWWKRLGDGGREPDPTKQHYVERVDLLCRILYVYYTCVLAKLPSWCASEVPKGIWSTYADAENPVWDDFPVDPTDDGFKAWIERGAELIEQSGAPVRVAKI
ncbi:predicted protein [Aspergillus nidulans FGSC A4]|uniref:Zn(II)2Cys6 transcription factor (Eurofung) n=1 Tax=Emericella nidulans (strain FGSC A4 / ATCC 38163 / CBS 112.46 / NRRL 194 / M139) TaxID=227321 RepID=Q5B604_EMENI|nr:hypothetical protein [Aspergillus nidulans FGSC A4]EAA59497.1 predicted protein [Aspergillus nidulans FGSC A4]CBF74860.1 TPA: Putative Zn(II)2Cys6 transcription factor (Eurofung) [Aspergillus nidulans FGSC A4]|eukprot:XP_661630.1 predicted protein [Aspergillus nidulans FGSC A4]